MGFELLRKELVDKLNAFCTQTTLNQTTPVNKQQDANIVYMDNNNDGTDKIIVNNNTNHCIINNHNNSQNAVKFINNNGNGNGNQIVYVTNGAVDLLSSAKLQTSVCNASPYLITNNSGNSNNNNANAIASVPSSLTLLNIAQNSNSNAPPTNEINFNNLNSSILNYPFNGLINSNASNQNL